MLKVRRALVAGAAAALLFSFLSVLSVCAEEIPWLTDFEAAKAKAKAENKQLFVDFTGSDWCVWCKRLHKEVFDLEAFQSEAPKQFIFVELDYPREKVLPDELKAQNKKLVDYYKILGYPTIILLDPDGLEIARTGYKAGGPESYLKHLAELNAIYKTVVQMKGDMEKATGIDRAKILDKIVDAYEQLNNQSEQVGAASKEIVSLDPDNKSGLKNKHEFLLLMAEAKSLQRAKNFDGLKEVLDKALALSELTGKQKFDVYQMRALCANYQQDYPNVIAFLEKAIQSDPENPGVASLKSTLKNISGMVKAQEEVKTAEAALEKSEGLDRAKVLDALIAAKEGLSKYRPAPAGNKEIEKLCQEIISLDPENKTGLKPKAEFRVLLIQGNALSAAGKYEEAQAAFDKALATLGITPEQTQSALTAKAIDFLRQKKLEMCIENFQKALDAAPESNNAAYLTTNIAQLKKQLEQSKAEAKASADSAPQVDK